jgi:ABC-type multidrug transport system fused ATPase/permease subunit
MLSTFKKIFDLFINNDRKRVAIIFAMVVVTGFLDMIGIASIVPFVMILSNENLIESNTYLSAVYNTLSFKNTDDFRFALGMVVLIFLIVSLAFKALTTYAQYRFTLMREYTVGKRLLESYLHMPYHLFLNRNTADLTKIIFSELSIAIYSGLIPFMTMISNALIVFFIVFMLTIMDVTLAVTIGVALTFFYILIYKFTGNFLESIGKKRAKFNQSRYEAVIEAFGAATQVKVGGLEQVYIRRFAVPARLVAHYSTLANSITTVPRFLLEAIAFGGLILTVLYLILKKGSFLNALPIITLYAFAGYRLIPSMQAVYSSISQIRFAIPAINALHLELKNMKLNEVFDNEERLPVNKFICLKNIYYAYPKTSKQTLSDITITIPANSTVGFVGPTGSGKTTIVNLILGLLKPQQGKLEIDGKIINKSNRRAWQRSIGYVPQQIYLADDTVASNIALGIEKEDLNQDNIEYAATVSNIHNFIINEMPEGYQTKVGERGIRLSGGQRQRIGIARALYHKPKILILDEATSALDRITEQSIIDSINKISDNITVIIISHRLNTLKNCDNIFVINKGIIHDQGTFKELQITNKIFREMLQK